MPFREPDDRLWEAVRPLLPAPNPRGGAKSDLRRLFSGVLYVLSTGFAWADTPRCYGAKSTVHRLHLRLCRSGSYPRLLEVMRQHGYDTERIDLSRCPRADGLRTTRLSDWAGGAGGPGR
ncbi:MAG TPA: transposase [Methanoregulaceae archaeon]|nr:transposase [Methanoregulaceae archaeon]HQJ87457.1 transposase [Methanoregulaceae archaeon]